MNNEIKDYILKCYGLWVPKEIIFEISTSNLSTKEITRISVSYYGYTINKNRFVSLPISYFKECLHRGNNIEELFLMQRDEQDWIDFLNTL